MWALDELYLLTDCCAVLKRGSGFLGVKDISVLNLTSTLKVSGFGAERVELSQCSL